MDFPQDLKRKDCRDEGKFKIVINALKSHENKTNIEMLQFAFLQLAKKLELEKHLPSMLFLSVTNT